MFILTVFLVLYLKYHNPPIPAAAKKGMANRNRIPLFNPFPCVLPFSVAFAAVSEHIAHCAFVGLLLSESPIVNTIVKSKTLILFMEQIYALFSFFSNIGLLTFV